MNPPAPDALGVYELAQRWGISPQAADDVTHRPGFPMHKKLQMGRVWSEGDVERWEQAAREAGRPIPGERPRGPRSGR